jgi:3-deoxy-7-phosphoheptulonate synthase
MTSKATAWTPSSWRSHPVSQAVEYPSNSKLQEATKKLQSLPGLVTKQEIQSLRTQLASVARGKAFLLQGGDCAELFADCVPEKIEGKVKLLLLMSLIIIWGARIPVIRVGRIAGQYAKPRSKATEIVNIDGKAQEVMTFRGDNVNGFSEVDRTPDPNRLLSAYFYSCATLNHIRASLASGLADLHAPLSWTTSHVRSNALAQQFTQIVSSLTDALDFMRVIGAEGSQNVLSNLETVDYFISHEALMLEYEEAMTRVSVENKPDAEQEEEKRYYDLSAHSLWLGDRTRQVQGAHAEFLRGIENPIGIKVGPSMTASGLLELLEVIDSSRGRDLGRVTLICRFGKGKSQSSLPALISAIQQSAWAYSVIWCCDPMHGNTVSSPSDPNLKTRVFGDVMSELHEQLEIHRQCNSRLGGIHLELTGETDEFGDSVTECTGGAMGLEDSQLKTRYRVSLRPWLRKAVMLNFAFLSHQTHCDPRLNLEQSLDVAFLLSNSLKGRRLGHQTTPASHQELLKELLNGS